VKPPSPRIEPDAGQPVELHGMTNPLGAKFYFGCQFLDVYKPVFVHPEILMQIILGVCFRFLKRNVAIR
jgi:hypothetical protein